MAFAALIMKESCVWLDEQGYQQVRAGSVGELLNLHFDICEICSLYISNLTFKTHTNLKRSKICSSHTNSMFNQCM